MFWRPQRQLATASIVLLFILVLTRPARACMWDRDTIAEEAKGIPEVVDVITGWFDRNPPMYYQMRLDRVEAELKKDPTNLDLYDDAGVAADRLGKGDEAIGWMEKKLGQLNNLPANDARGVEHRYRYLSNVGTMWVHRWLRNGADRTRIHEVEVARDFIAEAIKLNPDAHFGREKYQLLALNWIINPPRVKENEEYAQEAARRRAQTQPSDDGQNGSQTQPSDFQYLPNFLGTSPQMGGSFPMLDCACCLMQHPNVGSFELCWL